jgi:tetratricopeptide (TPR) repeat protein
MLATNYSIMAIDGYAPPSESWPHVLDYAQQALHLDPSLLAPHLEIGSEAFFNQWNWALAEKEYQIGASASGGPISEVLGGYEMERWAVGQPADALRLIRKYRELDLVSPSWMLKEADLLLWMGQNEKAVDIYDAVISDAREDDRAYFGKAEARAAQQRFDEAIALLAKGYQAAGQDDERFAKLLATARGEKGYRQMQRMGAQLELEGLNQRTATGRYVSPLDFARACSRLGYGEEAFKYLDRAFADVAPGLVFLKVDRAWTAIREDPRFGSAVKRVGLP